MYLRKLNIGITCIAGITYQYVISTCTVNNRFSKQTDELTHRKVKCCGSFWLLFRVVLFFCVNFVDLVTHTFFYTVCCWPQFQFTQMMYSKLFINVGVDSYIFCGNKHFEKPAPNITLVTTYLCTLILTTMQHSFETSLHLSYIRTASGTGTIRVIRWPISVVLIHWYLG